MSVTGEAVRGFSPDEARAAARALRHQAPAARFLRLSYPHYDALRAHHPVRRMPDGSWLLTRYDDAPPPTATRRRHQLTRRRVRAEVRRVAASPEHHTTSLVFNDPPLHTRVRRAILGALSQRHIAAMEPGLVALVDRLLDAMAARGRADADRGFRRRDPGRDHRQSARACRMRIAGRCAAGRLRSSARSSRC